MHFIKLSTFLLCAVLILQQSEASAKKRKHVICYHGTWATYRKSQGKFDVADIDPSLCTHLMYAFFGIEETGELRIIDPYLDLEDNSGRGNVRKFNELKLKNPTLKTLAAVGGWNEGSKKFSIVAADPQKRAVFVSSVVRFIQRHSFDGLDLDWEYPQQRHNLTHDDRTNFVAFLRELREGLNPFGYMLTAAVGSAEFSASVSYDIPEVAQYLDIISVMAYDLHGPWDDVVGINAPLYAGPSDHTARDLQLNLDAIAKYWLSQGAPREKLAIGVPFYGRSFTLEDSAQHAPGAPHLGRGIAGQYSVEPGVVGYNELCEKMAQESWTVEWESAQMVPYAFKDRQWVGFESPRSIELKAQYIKDHDLAGVMVWSLESDDFKGACGDTKYPLLKTINRVLFGSTASGEELTMESAETNQTSVPKDSHEEDSTSTLCKDNQAFTRDPTDCNRYSICVAGVPYGFQCPFPLVFDLDTSTCNYARFVKC